jgi:hypothetical protein
MSDKDKCHVPAYPKHKVLPGEFLEAIKREQHSTQNFVWLRAGKEMFATVSYDCNGMAIGVKINDEYFIYD